MTDITPEAARILDRVRPWFASEGQAYAWYNDTPLPGFGAKTAADLVSEKHAEWVMNYLDGVEAGIHV